MRGTGECSPRQDSIKGTSAGQSETDYPCWAGLCSPILLSEV